MLPATAIRLYTLAAAVTAVTYKDIKLGIRTVREVRVSPVDSLQPQACRVPSKYQNIKRVHMHLARSPKSVMKRG
jgi:hypothetical protein